MGARAARETVKWSWSRGDWAGGEPRWSRGLLEGRHVNRNMNEETEEPGKIWVKKSPGRGHSQVLAVLEEQKDKSVARWERVKGRAPAGEARWAAGRGPGGDGGFTLTATGVTGGSKQGAS